MNDDAPSRPVPPGAPVTADRLRLAEEAGRLWGDQVRRQLMAGLGVDVRRDADPRPVRRPGTIS